MADESEQIEIDINAPDEAEKAKEPEVAVAPAEEAVQKKEIEPDEGLEALKAQLEREKFARIEAEKRAREHAETAAKAKNEVQDSNLHLVNNAIETVKQNTEILKSQYAEAMATSDFMRAAEIQTAMSTNSAKLLQLEQGKQALESTPKSAPERVMPSDPVEALASQLSSRSADWVRRNPQCVTDPRMYQKMIAAHNLAMADGHKADTDEYFAAIEDTLKINRRENVTRNEDPTADAAKVTQRRSAPPAAPVTRSGTANGSSPNVVRLTAAEREIASMMGMTDKEYAKHKVALQREGKLN